jgi:hypothetical protein
MSKSTDDKKAFNNAKFYTLSAAVRSVLEDIQAGNERFNHFMKWAVDGYKRFHFDAGHEYNFEIIDMKPHKQIDFPCDFVDWTFIGFKTGNSLTQFTKDRNIPMHFDIIDCVPQENKDVNAATELLAEYDWFYNDEIFTQGHHYGLPAGYNHAGYFDVDWKNRVFNFKKVVSVATQVYLVYIGDGINPNGRTIIHPYVFKCIQDYIHWQRREHDDRYSAGEAHRAKHLFEEEFDRVLMRQLDLSLEDIKEALRSGNKQTPKG